MIFIIQEVQQILKLLKTSFAVWMFQALIRQITQQVQQELLRIFCKIPCFQRITNKIMSVSISFENTSFVEHYSNNWRKHISGESKSEIILTSLFKRIQDYTPISLYWLVILRKMDRIPNSLSCSYNVSNKPSPLDTCRSHREQKLRTP